MSTLLRPLLLFAFLGTQAGASFLNCDLERFKNLTDVFGSDGSGNGGNLGSGSSGDALGFDSCDPEKYAWELAAKSYFLLGIAVLLILCVPFSACLRCCNLCGGKKPSFGLCCPSADPVKVYSKSTVKRLKISSAVAAFIYVLGPVLIGLGIFSLTGIWKDLYDGYKDLLADLTSRMDTIEAALESLKSGGKATVDYVTECTAGGGGSSGADMSRAFNAIPDFSDMTEPLNKAQDKMEDYDKTAKRVLGAVRMVGMLVLFAPLLVILKAVCCGPICNKRGGKVWCCPLCGIWKIAIIAAFLGAFAMLFYAVTADLVEILHIMLDALATAGSSACDEVSIVDLSVLEKPIEASTQLVCTLVAIPGVCGGFPDNKCVLPSIPKPFPTTSTNNTCLPFDGAVSVFDCCPVIKACREGKSVPLPHVKNLMTNLYLNPALASPFGLCPGKDATHCSMEKCQTDCTEPNPKQSLKKYASTLGSMVKATSDVDEAISTSMDTLRSCSGLLEKTLNPAREAADTLVSALNKIRMGLILLMAGAILNIFIYWLGMKRWWGMSELEEERKKHYPEPPPKKEPEVPEVPEKVVPVPPQPALDVETWAEEENWQGDEESPLESQSQSQSQWNSQNSYESTMNSDENNSFSQQPYSIEETYDQYR